MGWLNFGKLFGSKPKPTPSVTTPIVVVNKNDATRKTDLINLKTALKKYYNAKQSYPTSITLSKTSDPDSPLKVLVPDFIASLPIDPLSPNNYYGYKSEDGKTFEITAVLEDKSDQAGIVVGTLFLYKVTDSSSDTPSTSNPSADSTMETDLPVDDAPTMEGTEVEIDSSSSSSTSGSASANATAETVTP
jgi:hypothetical protein